ncbi:MAG: PA0069 family radical SAM protein [Polyangiaceae bacterium]|nr:PA0069 family radical SAM protein [Polyangiaceae bacterium]
MPLRRLAVANPPSRWAELHVEWDEAPSQPLEVHEDHSRSILSHNDSPDLGFDHSLNPYRGCAHGCAYCYARPTHEWLGWGAGTDFDRRILVKPRAAELLREAFEQPSWRGELVLLSGVTDCYQPLEASLGLTRGCLEVLLEYKNPAAIITKSALIERDVELLAALSREAGLTVSVSLPLLDARVARALEPYAPPPERRLRTIERLARAGIPVGVNVAPVVPGLSERGFGPLLERAAAAGARSACMILLRLPGAVAAVFEERLRAALPEAADRVLARVREIRGGRANDPTFHRRMEGSGVYAEALRALFGSTARRHGLVVEHPGRLAGPSRFQRPARSGRQLALF